MDETSANIDPEFRREIAAGAPWVKSREATLLIVIAAVAIVLSIVRAEAFLDWKNFEAIANGMVYDLLMATGLTLVLMVGGIDLSVGSVLALTGVATTLMMKEGMAVYLAIPLGLLIAAAIGAFSGFFVARAKIAPFIVTLAVMSIARGAALVMTSGYYVSGLPESYLELSRDKVLYIPLPFLITVVFLVCVEVLIRYWRPLHQAFYIGMNYEAARLAGMPVRLVIFAVFIVSAVAAGMAALFMTSRLGMGFSGFGMSSEMRAIAAAVIGGASMSGGSGSVIGAALGVILLALINNGFVLLNGSPNWQQAVSGLILLAAVAVDAYRRRKERKE
ncbi:MAG: ABC transporter permease [Planctomycetota bacterium]|jgi:ribose transport system permease protein|nr:ABC transporter permease [Planctomycetota bacterium]